eukprot:Nk52_evm42s252 gene=Nk52_evmTU42s252
MKSFTVFLFLSLCLMVTVQSAYAYESFDDFYVDDGEFEWFDEYLEHVEPGAASGSGSGAGEDDIDNDNDVTQIVTPSAEPTPSKTKESEEPTPAPTTLPSPSEEPSSPAVVISEGPVNIDNNGAGVVSPMMLATLMCALAGVYAM